MNQSIEYQGRVFREGQEVWPRLPTTFPGPYTIIRLNNRSCIVQTKNDKILLRRYSSLTTLPI